MNIIDIKLQKNIANKQTVGNILATDMSTSGNTRSSSSIVELLVVLFFYITKYKISAPQNLAVGGGSPEQDLLLAVNMAYAAKYSSNQPPRKVYCLVEEDKLTGNVIWQLLTFIGNYGLDNLVITLDVSKTARMDPILTQNTLKSYGALLEQKGYYTVIVNGDITQLIKAYDAAAASSGKPTIIIATVAQMKLEQLPVFCKPPTLKMGLNSTAKGFCYIRVDTKTDIANLDNDLLQSGDAIVICHVEEDEVVAAGVDLTVDEVLALPELKQHPTRIAVTNPSRTTSLEAILKKTSNVTGTTLSGGNNQTSGDIIKALCLAVTVSHGTDYEYKFASGVPRSGAERSYVDERGICAAYVL